ncbi:MAG: nitroreductase/quinone reductase family protein [Gammaproteobacteria bacterium]
MTEPATSASRAGIWRAFSRIIAVPWISFLTMRTATVIDRPLMRLTGGRWRLSFVIPCLLLRCRGARTGRLREVPLLYVQDGDDVLLIGSGGGAEREPAWCANLRAVAGVECDRAGQREKRVAEELQGPARERAFAHAVQVYPGYARYQRRLTRQIAVFRLRPG